MGPVFDLCRKCGFDASSGHNESRIQLPYGHQVRGVLMKSLTALLFIAGGIAVAQVTNPADDNAPIHVRETVVNVPVEKQRAFLINHILYGKTSHLIDAVSERGREIRWGDP